MKVEFETTKEGLAIIDPIERKRYPIKTDSSVTPESEKGDRIPYSMDSTISITTSEVTLAENNVIYVRYQDGTLCTEIHSGEKVSLPEDEYLIDISSSIKVYLHVFSSVDIRIEATRTTIAFETSSDITIGARSFHRRPAETITTTANPTDVMKAVSMFSLALKSTTAERSYPTHRGHPPAFELGEKLSIPTPVERTETDVTIEIPPTLRHVFSIVSLAYYIGAEVVPGPTPQLRTETGYVRSLLGENGFETTVARTLKQIFFFDCIIQTEGESPSSLHTRRTIEPLLDFDIDDLYGQPIAQKIETYLEVSFETIASELPEWYSEVHLPVTANHIEFLPFIANDLAIVKPLNKSNGVPFSDREGQNEGKTNNSTGEKNNLSPIFQQRWISGDGYEVVNTKPLTACQNSISQLPRKDPLKIEVVCNDPTMNDELVTVHSTYNDTSAVPFDITIHHDLTTEELRDVFAKESDFLHYIGHIDSNGFRCSDGTVDSTNLEQVKTKAFFLNACRSYKQGLELIEAGCIGGIVTLTEIRNRVAVAAGSTIARLLNRGLPLHAALHLLQQTTTDEQHYHLLGDGLLSVSHLDIGPPITIQIAEDDSGYEELLFRTRIRDTSQDPFSLRISPILIRIISFQMKPHFTTSRSRI